MKALLAVFSIMIFGAPAYAQAVVCGNDAIRDFQRICGRNIDEGPCNADDAKIGVDWVIYKDSGAQNTFKGAMKACKYSNALGYAYLSIMHAQRHNKDAMCNLLACYGPMVQHPVNYMSTVRFQDLLK